MVSFQVGVIYRSEKIIANKVQKSFCNFHKYSPNVIKD